MSSKPFKSQASSSRVVSSAFGVPAGAFGNAAFGSPQAFSTVSSFPLSYVYEPLDLGGVTEPNVVVALKNLQKKNGTTKTKALEDLLAYISSEPVRRAGVEDPLLEAWIKLYPRASIDSSRRVRQLAHTLHGDISSSSGKRFAKHMPKSVGAWLAGLQDNDRIVSRAAQGALEKVFPSEDKQKTVWKVFQQPILDYCRDAVLKQSVQTLSDERTASPDDAEAKYARVIGTAILTVASALDILPADDLGIQRESYREFFQTKGILDLAGHGDSFVRKAVYRLVLSGIKKQVLAAFDMTMISTYLIQEALHIDQTGSVYDYVKILAQLTAVYPEVWTEYYTGSGKKSALKRLCQFLRKGSQGGPSDFWNQIAAILQRLPLEVLRPDPENEGGPVPLEDATSPTTAMLAAIHDGIVKKEEHRSNRSEGWRTYVGAVDFATRSEPNLDKVRVILKVSVLPIIEQYIKPSAEGTRWTISTPDQDEICADALRLVLDRAPDLFEQTWRRLSLLLLQELQMSHPEQSKDHTKSQDAGALMAKRWYSLQAGILGDTLSEKLRSVFTETSASEIRSIVEVLRVRNGKPYSAAAALDFATGLAPESTIKQSDSKEVILGFAKSDLPKLLLSPSSSYLINLLNTLKDEQGICDTYQVSIKALADAPDSVTKFKTLQSLVSSPWIGREGISNDLVAIVKKALQLALRGNKDRWHLVTAAIGNRSTPSDVSDEILSTMVESLSIEGTEAGALRGLDLVAGQDEAVFKHFSSSPKGATLLSRLLFLTESSNMELSQEARRLSNLVWDALSKERGLEVAKSSMFEIIQKGIDAADPNSLSVASLLSEATHLFREASDDDKPTVAKALLPNASSWTKALEPFLCRRPDSSLALTNPLGGAINFVKGSTELEEAVARDSTGYSSALRMAWFVTELCTFSNIFDFITADHRSSTCRNLAIFIMLATDSIGIPQPDGLWLQTDSVSEMEPLNLVGQAQSVLASWINNPSLSDKTFVESAQTDLLASSQGISSTAYYSARAYAAITSELEDLPRISSTQSDEAYLQAVRDFSNPIYTAACFIGVIDSKLALRICNKLVADLTGLRIADMPVEGLHQLVLLNISIRKLDDYTQIPQPRLVFFVRHMVSQLRDNRIALEVVTEIHKALAVMLPQVKEVYESFWERLIDTIVDGWFAAAIKNLSDISSLHASLRLCAILQALSVEEESNDDLKDSWTEKRSAIVDHLVKIMKLQAGKLYPLLSSIELMPFL
ncbi:hypothetical protein MMC30_002100 [Trapelia coarctata]|nr:hypothetical protein [Trapelia coarctata]